MAKAKSQGDSIDDNSPLYATATTTSSHTQPAQQDHLYEEVQPKHLTYVDIDLSDKKRLRDRTFKWAVLLKLGINRTLDNTPKNWNTHF